MNSWNCSIAEGPISCISLENILVSCVSLVLYVIYIKIILICYLVATKMSIKSNSIREIFTSRIVGDEMEIGSNRNHNQ